VRIASANFANHLEGRIVRFVRGEQDFVIGIVLPEKTFDVLLQPRFQTMHRLEHGDCREMRIVRNRHQLLACVRMKSSDSDNREAKKHSRRQSTYYSHTQ